MAKITVWGGTDPRGLSREQVGGKGLNLLKLYDLSKQTGLFDVPEFFIIPTTAVRYHAESESGHTQVVYENAGVKVAFDRLKKPVKARSSSPLEDGLNASFAGKFKSIGDLKNYVQFCIAADEIYESAYEGTVRAYADRMHVEFSREMAIIVQEQITDAKEWGIIQLDGNKALTESNNGRHEDDIDFLHEEYFSKWREHWPTTDWISEGDSSFAVCCANEAKERLGLEGIVQVEFFLAPKRLPRFVQIRQLPKTKPYASLMDLKIPEGAPYLESDICNEVAGELVLPAYVTLSQAGHHGLLVVTGQQGFLGIGNNDERADSFYKQSKLAENADFEAFMSLAINWQVGVERLLPSYEAAWKRGNSLFPNYILVCDRLDETVAAMNELTTNKRAIITCMNDQRTSHAMTVATEMGIMCLCTDNAEEITSFYHQVETGDIVHIKSNGKRAVAYLEKKRVSNPYVSTPGILSRQ